MIGSFRTSIFATFSLFWWLLTWRRLDKEAEFVSALPLQFSMGVSFVKLRRADTPVEVECCQIRRYYPLAVAPFLFWGFLGNHQALITVIVIVFPGSAMFVLLYSFRLICRTDCDRRYLPLAAWSTSTQRSSMLRFAQMQLIDKALAILHPGSLPLSSAVPASTSGPLMVFAHKRNAIHTAGHGARATWWERNQLRSPETYCYRRPVTGRRATLSWKTV